MTSSPIGDPQRVRDQARELDLARTITDQVRGDVTGRAHVVSWLGHSADRMRHAVDSVQSSLVGIENDLAAAINAMNRNAGWIEQQQAELLRLERRILTWARANPPGSHAGTGHPDASVIRQLPGRFDPAWRTLALRLRRLGVVF